MKLTSLLVALAGNGRPDVSREDGGRQKDGEWMSRAEATEEAHVAVERSLGLSGLLWGEAVALQAAWGWGGCRGKLGVRQRPVYATANFGLGRPAELPGGCWNLQDFLANPGSRVAGSAFKESLFLYKGRQRSGLDLYWDTTFNMGFANI